MKIGARWGCYSVPNKLQHFPICSMNEFTCTLLWTNTAISCSTFRKGKQAVTSQHRATCHLHQDVLRTQAESSQIKGKTKTSIPTAIAIFFFITPIIKVGKRLNCTTMGRLKKKKKKVGSRLAAQPLPQHPEHPPAMPKVKSFRQVQRSSKGS